AQTTVTLGKFSDQLSTVTAPLNAIAKRPSVTPLLTPPSSWTAIVATSFPLPTNTYNSNASPSTTDLQQILLCGASTVLVRTNTRDTMPPADCSPIGSAKIQMELNWSLKDIDLTEATIAMALLKVPSWQ
ncbi:hypothetical protein H0H87_000574, partial [Tephrocybe sp. NHM501043]